MKIALINENSQAAKNSIIEAALSKVAKDYGYEVVNYGMYSADDKAQLTYVQNGILAAILLNSGACDFVVTGCGTGEGAMLALNSFPGVICGHVENPLDAYTFAQINDGNAISIPFALGFGWGGELNLQYIFEKLFSEITEVPLNGRTYYYVFVVTDIFDNAYYSDMATIEMEYSYEELLNHPLPDGVFAGKVTKIEPCEAPERH